MELDKEKKAAQRNFEQLVANAPTHLSEKEDKFSTQLKKAKKSHEKKTVDSLRLHE
ncbi:hypothetical protein [Neptuniibacter marinus]|uniref:hypothetical protein n=1 Tax=Neptuniibacter marinus TaxID=1806670 RepID=UPI000AA0446E|nr:hypothetical protein [Neptuniibacter marinus]